MEISFSSPEIDAPYITEEEKERLLGLYQYLHSRAHNSSRPLSYIYYTGSNENLLAWVSYTSAAVARKITVKAKPGAVTGCTSLLSGFINLELQDQKWMLACIATNALFFVHLLFAGVSSGYISQCPLT